MALGGAYRRFYDLQSPANLGAPGSSPAPDDGATVVPETAPALPGGPPVEVDREAEEPPVSAPEPGRSPESQQGAKPEIEENPTPEPFEDPPKAPSEAINATEEGPFPLSAPDEDDEPISDETSGKNTSAQEEEQS